MRPSKESLFQLDQKDIYHFHLCGLLYIKLLFVWVREQLFLSKSLFVEISLAGYISWTSYFYNMLNFKKLISLYQYISWLNIFKIE